MAKVGIFMADGCEEIEALTVVDMLRRAGIEIEMISITGNEKINGAHGIRIISDIMKENADYKSYDGIILPGGMPGTLNLGNDEMVQRVIKKFSENKLIAAICAAPSVLGMAGLLKGKKATCYPSFEEKLLGATCVEDSVVTDGNVITSRGMGTAIDFSLAIIKYFLGEEKAQEMSKSIIYR